MRPVNLIPKDVRRVASAATSSRYSYLILGALGVVLLAVTAIVVTDNQVSSRKAEIAKLDQQQVDAKARADALQSFASFQTMEQSRTATITSLAKSRFDWQRVLQEMAVVIPSDIQLTALTGTVAPGVELGDSTASTTRGSVTGPALEISGCAPSQDSVARFVSSLEDIDGVTRVGLESSQTAAGTSSAGAGASTGSSTGGGQDCQSSANIYKFAIVTAFDAASVAAPATGSAPSTPSTTPVPPSSNDGGVGQTKQQEASVKQSTKEQSDKAHQAVKDYVPGN